MKNLWYYDLSLGRFGLVENQGKLTHLLFDGTKKPDALIAETPLLREAARQLQEYCSGQRREFELPFSPEGTDFQKRVWNALLQIPYGTTCTYRMLAVAIGSPMACRAVGMANHRNPLPIFIPCHRVIGADGSLTGYAGGLELKEKLLQLEQTAYLK